MSFERIEELRHRLQGAISILASIAKVDARSIIADLLELAVIASNKIEEKEDESAKDRR